MARRKKHNPERRAWRGKSYRKGGTPVSQLKSAPAEPECPDSPTGQHEFSPDEEYAQKHHLAEGPICCEHCGEEPAP